jgi:hypothetical protein
MREELEMAIRRRRAVIMGLLTAALALSACEDDGDGDTPTTSTSGPTSTTVADTSTTSSPASTVATITTTTRVAAPPQVTGLTAQTGGGSGEVQINWSPLPASADVASYRLYKRQSTGTELPPVTVAIADLDTETDGRFRVIDAFDTGPWQTADPTGPRCYKASGVSTGGIEGPLSAEACGAPVGGG